MADKKISALPAATTPLAGTEVLPVVQGGTTDKVSVADLTAGRAVSVGSLASAGSINVADNFSVNWGNGNSYIKGNGAGFTLEAYVAATKIWGIDGSGATTYDYPVKLNNVNLVVGTAGKGIDFSANGGDVLSQYDEGTWTPVVASGTGAITSYSSSGTYTRIGRQVTITAAINITNNGTGGTYVRVSGLPFTIGGQGASGAVYESAVTGNTCVIQGPNGGTLFNLWTYNNGYPGATGATFNLSFTYIV